MLLDVAVSHREDFQGRNEAAMHVEYLGDFCYSLTTFEGTNTLPNIHVVWKMITHIFELDQLCSFKNSFLVSVFFPCYS